MCIYFIAHKNISKQNISSVHTQNQVTFDKKKKKKNKILECAALSNGELIGLQDMLFVKNFSSFWYFKFYK